MANKLIWYKYARVEHDEGIDDAVAFQSRHHSGELIAVDAADWHHAHGGWEASWPMVYDIYVLEGGARVGRFTVYRETVPEFHAVATV